MNRCRAAWASPLRRHPALLLRKIRDRLRGHRRMPFAPTPRPLAYKLPPDWCGHLQVWLASIPWKKDPLPFNRVFGRDFPEELLLRHSQEGPSHRAPGLTADIKLGWEFSRAYSVFLRAATAPEEAGPSGEFLRQWLRANGAEEAVSRQCPMEVAIRMVNWILADSLHQGFLSASLGSDEWKEELWRSGNFLWKNLEARWFSSNHYLAGLLGLWVLGSAFPLEKQAQLWKQFADREFPQALRAQTRTDGGLRESSLRYHAYVTEMALLFRYLRGKPFPAPAELRLLKMCQVVADFRDASGDVFPFGDDDGGRILNVDTASILGRADVLLGLAERIWRHRFYPAPTTLLRESGWWVHRQDEFTVALDFGGVGLWGLGAHAHNGQLSFCLEWRGVPVVVDPGTYLYTGDPQSRQRFRSALSHNAPRLGDEEPLPLPHELFALPGPDYAGPLSQPEGRAPIFHNHALTVSRQIEIQSGRVMVRDRWTFHKPGPVRWAFYLHPQARPSQDSSGWLLEIPGAGRLRLMAPPGSQSQCLSGFFSSSYGQAEPCHKIEAEGPTALSGEAAWEFRVEESS